jgi:hypothetical protein
MERRKIIEGRNEATAEARTSSDFLCSSRMEYLRQEGRKEEREGGGRGGSEQNGREAKRKGSEGK